jgi:hypothetical protein
MSAGGRVRVVVRSRRVPAGTVQVQQKMYSPYGISVTTTSRQVLYDYVLDEDHQRAIEEARRLAGNLCLDLEVVDSGRQGFLGRLASSLGRRATGNPTVVVSPTISTVTPEPSPALPGADSGRH